MSQTPQGQKAPINNPLSSKIQLGRGPLGLVIGLAILGYCSYRIGPEAILQSLRQVELPFLAFAILLISCWVLLGALNIRTMLTPLAKVEYAKVLRAYSNANMVALIMPGQVGDVIIVKFFRNLNIPVAQGITLFATDKVVTLFWYTAFALYGFYLAKLWRPLTLLFQGQGHSLPLAFGGIAILGVLLLFCSRPILSLFSARIRNWLALARTYLQKARKAILLNIAITLARVVVMGGAYWLTIRAYGPSPTFMQALCFAIIAGLVAYVPVSFNGLGTVEAALIYLFNSAGIDSAPVISMAITMRIEVITAVSICAIISNINFKNTAYG